MKIINILPISRGIQKETLSYFTSEDLPLGSIVEVPLRKKKVSGIVISSDDVEKMKMELKTLPFEMRKISELKANDFFLPEFIETAKLTADYFASSTGSVLKALTPKVLIDSIDKIIINHAKKDTPSLHEKYIIQAPDDERYPLYKSFIREEFAKKSSIFFCLPTIHDIQNLREKLEKGIEEYTYILHTSLSKKEILAITNKLLQEKHPVLIIANGTFLSIPRKDISAIIIERENSKSYKISMRPYLDIRTFAEILSKKIKAKLVFGDIFVSIETMYRHQNGEFQDLYPPKFRSLATSQELIVDMKKTHGLFDPEKKFTVLSNELISLIEMTQKNNQNMFIFSARRGLSPTTICRDCGVIVLCNTCHSPIVLHTSPQGNIFLCHKCGERRSADERCKNCDSWRMMTLGIGIEQVEKEIREKFPNLKIFTIDKDTAKSHKNALKIKQAFYSTPGSILLGTEMALLYLDKNVENSSVATIDSLFSIPDFRINERVCGIILKIREMTIQNMILQTRDSSLKVFEYATKGNLIDFYRDEIAMRKAFDYPPFRILIKISFEGNKDRAVEEMTKVKELFHDEELDIFPSFVKSKKGKSIMHALLKIKNEKWPNKEILDKLRSLPPQFTIKVDPESLL
jgi:primosomal protein N'